MDKINHTVAADGGYGWVVCFAACLVQFLISGLQNNFGLMYIYILKELSDGGKAKSAWVGSINVGVCFMVSPLVTTLCRRLGCRLTGVIGGLLCVVGLVLSSITRSIDVLCVTYGVIVGIGCGLCYITTFRVLSLWFERRLVLVYYLATFWDACGRAVAAPCMQAVLAAVGLSKTFLILAGVLSICSLAAISYRPAAQSPDEEQEMFVAIRTTEKNPWFDFSVLKHKPYVTFVIGTSILSVAFSVTYVHVPSFAKEVGIPETKTALLLSTEAPSLLIAALLFSKIVDYFSSHHLEFYQVGFLLFALTQTFMAVARTFTSFVALMVAHGIATGVTQPLRPVLAEQILGKNKASEGVGLLFGMLGFAYISGPPLAGWIYDISHSYPLAFFVSGGLCAMAACILHLVPVFQENKKNTTPERTFCNKYPGLGLQDPCHEKIASSTLQSSQVDTPQRDWNQFLAEARETEV